LHLHEECNFCPVEQIASRRRKRHTETYGINRIFMKHEYYAQGKHLIYSRNKNIVVLCQRNTSLLFGEQEYCVRKNTSHLSEQENCIRGTHHVYVRSKNIASMKQILSSWERRLLSVRTESKVQGNKILSVKHI
jgi:hypothetical protein